MAAQLASPAQEASWTRTLQLAEQLDDTTYRLRALAGLYLASTGVVPEGRTKILSTSGMITAARETTARKVLVATETGMLHQLRGANTTTTFEPVNPAAVCKYMKMITPAKLLRSLRDGVDEILIDEDIADRARLSVERMIAIGTPSATAE